MIKTMLTTSANKKNHKLFKTVLLIALCSLPIKILATEQSPNELGVIPGTIKNFIDYFQESIEDLKEDGVSGNIHWPQWLYDPGLGPIHVLPEFSGDLGIKATPLYLLDVPTIPFEFRPKISTPEVPATNRKVVGITESEGFTDPHIPPLRWTADGRLGVESQVGGSLEKPSPVSLYLLAPEKLNQPFVESSAGPIALALDSVKLPFNELAQGRTGTIQHTNICDPYIKAEGERHNPYSCGINGEDDCYDVTLVSGFVELSNSGEVPRLNDWDRILGTPLHIRVSKPKTQDARIEEVTYGEPKFSPNRTGVLFETITPADGRLFIARRGFLPLLWQNRATGDAQLGSYDVVYGVSPPEADLCDVSYWGDLYPITHAPYDERVNKRYAFAMQPFRDPSGAIIPDGVDIKGTYPWMDKEAKNFSVQVSPAKLFPSYSYDGNTQSRYPVRCVSEDECSFEHMKDADNSKDNMFVLMGAWTQGKMVLLDGKLNDVDFRLGGTDRTQSYLSLYQPGTGHNPNDSGEVRVGSTRGEGADYPVFNESGQLINHYRPSNFSMLDSIENRLNYLPNIKPSTFQDVVWNMSSGHSTVEFGFDDYLNPDGFIVSNMVAHMQHKNKNWYRMNYYDGWHQLTRTFNGQVRIQNSATALPDRWQIPSYGRVYHGRLEPVAIGGVRGKGMWFDGSKTRVDYKIPEQPQSVHEHNWFYSLFLDPRFNDDDNERVLIRFPDLSRLTIKGRSEIALYNSRKQLITRVLLPAIFPGKGWSQIALLVNAEKQGDEQQNLSLFINGYLHHAWSGTPYMTDIERDNFRPVPGKLRIGKGSTLSKKGAFKGWLDEFKVFAYKPNVESICNYAHGTLVGLPNQYEGKWRDAANLYSTESHRYVSRVLASYGQAVYPQYACYHDYSGDNKAHLNNIPEGTVALRNAVHFPEGPLYFDAPRPDSSANKFCLSCHHDKGVAGLGKDALVLNPWVDAKEDLRRQPTQPPAKVYGNVPAKWFPGAPAYGLDAGESGVHIDEWTQPSSVGVDPEIRNLVLADEHGHPWFAVNEEEAINISELPMGINQLSINVNGLVRSVNFDINGYQHFDDVAPYTFSVDYLEDGSNRIVVEARDDNGSQTTQVINVLINR